jgi:hypothetical protein
MAAEREQPKIGAGHLEAMIRAGGKELAQVLPAFPGHSVQPVEEPGLAGNLTPQEIVHGKSQYESMLDGYASRGAGREQQEKGIDR